MAVIELNESLSALTLGGKLAPKADQSKFSSVWAIKEGEARDLAGFPSQRDLSEPQPFGHGSNRALSGYDTFTTPAKGRSPGSEHIVTLNGVRLVEMIVPRADADARTKWEGDVSRSRVDNIKAEEIDKMARMGLAVPTEDDRIAEMPPEELSKQTTQR